MTTFINPYEFLKLRSQKYRQRHIKRRRAKCTGLIRLGIAGQAGGEEEKGVCFYLTNVTISRYGGTEKEKKGQGERRQKQCRMKIISVTWVRFKLP